jgi:hypothetical protein
MPRPQYPESHYLVPLVPRDDLLVDPRTAWDDGFRGAPIPILDFERQAHEQELAREERQQGPSWQAFARRDEFSWNNEFTDEQGYSENPSPPPYDSTPGAADLVDGDEVLLSTLGGDPVFPGFAEGHASSIIGDGFAHISELGSDSSSVSDAIPSVESSEAGLAREVRIQARLAIIQRDLEEERGQNNENGHERD